MVTDYTSHGTNILCQIHFYISALLLMLASDFCKTPDWHRDTDREIDEISLY